MLIPIHATVGKDSEDKVIFRMKRMRSAPDARSSLSEALSTRRRRVGRNGYQEEAIAPHLKRRYYEKLHPKMPTSILFRLKAVIPKLELHLENLIARENDGNRMVVVEMAEAMEELDKLAKGEWRFYLSDKKQSDLWKRVCDMRAEILSLKLVNIGKYEDVSLSLTKFFSFIKIADDALELIKGGTCRCGRQCCSKGYFRSMPEGSDVGDYFSRMLSGHVKQGFIDRVQLMLEHFAQRLHDIHNTAFARADSALLVCGKAIANLGRIHTERKQKVAKRQKLRTKRKRRLVGVSSSESEDNADDDNAELTTEDTARIVELQNERATFELEERAAAVLRKDEVQSLQQDGNGSVEMSALSYNDKSQAVVSAEHIRERLVAARDGRRYDSVHDDVRESEGLNLVDVDERDESLVRNEVRRERGYLSQPSAPVFLPLQPTGFRWARCKLTSVEKTTTVFADRENGQGESSLGEPPLPPPKRAGPSNFLRKLWVREVSIKFCR